MPGTENVSILVAFTAGLISFLSPCVLPLIPSYMAFITGISIEELSAEKSLRYVRKNVIINSLMFILGFSIIFIALGASATFLGTFLAQNIRWFEIGGGILVIILGILAAIVVPSLKGKTKQAKVAAAQSDIKGNMSMALDLYEVDNGGYPGSSQGLKALVEKPGSSTNWNGPYLKSRAVPKDPWGNEYIYVCPGSRNPEWYDLSSMGPDGKKDTDDDICNWEKE